MRRTEADCYRVASSYRSVCASTGLLAKGLSDDDDDLGQRFTRLLEFVSRLCISKLEGVAVERRFELARFNQLGCLTKNVAVVGAPFPAQHGQEHEHARKCDTP